MRVKISVIVSAVLLASLSVGSQAQAPGDRGSAEKTICKRLATTGSRVDGQKVCKTVAQWEQDRIRARRATEDKQRDNLLNTPRGG